MAASAQAQAEATREAQTAGIAHARAAGRGYLGRKPSYTRAQLDTVRDLLGQGVAISSIARTAGLSRAAVYRISADPGAAAAVLARWAA